MNSLDNLLLGPVVGIVTTTTARILFEFSSFCSLEYFVTSTTNNINSSPTSQKHWPHVKGRATFSARKPTAFTVSGLHPGNHYELRLGSLNNAACASFRTPPEEPRSLKVVCVSCNRLESPIEVDMWHQLYEDIQRNDLFVLLHMGDQVYMDGVSGDNVDDSNMYTERVRQEYGEMPYVKAHWVLKDVPPTAWMDKREEVLEIYRGRYRETWTVPSTALVLANISNLMIMDDHEFRDDFGCQEADSQKDSKEYFLGMVAYQCYLEYQRQLWDPNYDKHEERFNEFYHFVFGKLGIMFLDERGPFSLFQWKRGPNDTSYMGMEQMASIKRVLEEEEAVNTWIVCSPIPTVFLRTAINKLAAKTKIADDMIAFMNVAHSDSLVEFWDTFRRWKTDKLRQREVILVSGDVHIGLLTNIYYQPDKSAPKEMIFRQITSSAIKNFPFSRSSYFVLKRLLKMEESYDNYSYHHVEFVRERNYCVLRLDFGYGEEFRPTYSLRLVHEKGELLKDSLTELNTVGGIDCCKCNSM